MVELVGLVAIECGYAQNVEDKLYSKSRRTNLCDAHDMVELIDAINHSLVGAAPRLSLKEMVVIGAPHPQRLFCCGFRSCKSG